MIGLIIGGVIATFATIMMFAWYVIVPPSEAHLVSTPSSKFVASSDSRVARGGKDDTGTRWYFAIPDFIPFVGRVIRILDITIKELLVTQETIEEGQARYNVRSSTKYRIVDVQKAAETFINDKLLQENLQEIIKSAVRAVTVKYDVVKARADKQKMSDEVRNEITDDFGAWGLELVNFQLVDFQDTETSKIISNISKRREVEIESQTREQNAEKIKQAKIKEAESDEKAQEREIARDKVVGERQQEKLKAIAEQEKLAREEEFEVKKVEQVKAQEIEKERAIVKAEEVKRVVVIQAEQKKEAELIHKAQKLLEGEGDKLKAEEQAKGEAAPIREKGNAEADIIKAKGLAEAIAKDKLQEALNKFGAAAIQALVAEKIVEKDKEVGVATAGALEKADLKVFAGGDSDKQGFDLGKIIASTSVADETTAYALKNKLARPNDMGLTTLGLLEAQQKAEEETAKQKKTDSKK